MVSIAILYQGGRLYIRRGFIIDEARIRCAALMVGMQPGHQFGETHFDLQGMHARAQMRLVHEAVEEDHIHEPKQPDEERLHHPREDMLLDHLVHHLPHYLLHIRWLGGDLVVVGCGLAVVLLIIGDVVGVAVVLSPAPR